MAFVTYNLKLDKDEDTGIDDANSEQKPRRLVQIPSTNEIVAYGGTGPNVLKLLHNVETKSITTDSIRHWGDDESIRVVTISPDGKYVVVANDIWELKLYSYKNYDATTTSTHPFLDPNNDNNKDVCTFLDTFNAPIRDVQFHPNGSEWIAIATETGMGLINISEYGTSKKRYLWDECTEQYKMGGIRSVAIHQLSTTKVILASLSMDGKLSLWDVSDCTKPDEWKLITSETEQCITKKDVGEMLDTDPWDQSCRPLFVRVPCTIPTTPSDQISNDTATNNRVTILVLPGMKYLQLRRIDVVGDAEVKMEAFDQVNLDSTTDEVSGHTEPIVALTTSPKSSYLISTGRDKRIIVWSLHQRKIDGSIKAKFIHQIGQMESSSPTSTLWLKTDGTEKLFIIGANGNLLLMDGRENFIPTTLSTTKKENGTKSTESKKENSTKLGDTKENDTNSNKEDNIVTPNSILKDDTVHNTDNDNNVVNIPNGDIDNNTTEKKKKKKISFIDDEADEVIDEVSDEKQTVSSPEKADGADETILYDDIDKPSPPTKSTTMNDDFDDATDDDDDADSYDQVAKEKRVYATTTISLPEQQAPFGVSSTPLDLPRRFLCWNHIGSITLIRGDDESNNSIDIHFTDAFSRRNISFTDNLGFILGSLGEKGALFATDLSEDADDDDDDEDDVYLRGLSKTTKEAVKRDKRSSKNNASSSQPTGSTLYFNRFETFGHVRDKDWVLTLPSGERVVGCSCGDGWVAAITSRRFLRFYSMGGNQGHILWLPGEPVTIVGRGRLVAVFYHETEPLRDGTQKLGYILLDGTTAQIIAKGVVSAISSSSLLLWAGFSNDWSLVIMDSAGMVSMLIHSTPSSGSNNPNNWEWVPMLDTVGIKKSSDDSFWPIAVFDGKLVCVPLKGGTCFPDATRRPVTSAISFRMPLAPSTLAKGGILEELSLRAGIALHQKQVMDSLVQGEDYASERDYLALSAQVDKVTLKMFASAIAAGKLERALDLTERLHLEKSFDLAMTIADNHRKLVSLIEKSKGKKFEIRLDEHNLQRVDQSTFSLIDRKRISPDSVALKGKNQLNDSFSRNIRPKLS